MRRYVLSAAALLAVAFAAPSADDDTKYQIKEANFVAKGKSVKVTEKGTITVSAKVTDDKGNTLKDNKSQKRSLRVYVEKTLELTDKADKRKKYSRKYEKAKDVENDESESKPYQGRTIIYEKSDGTWKLTAEGNPKLGDDDLKELADDANKPDVKDDAFLPRKAVKVGETWKLSGKEVAEFFKELNFEADSVKGEGKLVKAYKKGKQQWGTIEYVITFKATFGELKGVAGQLTMTSDQAIDASTVAAKASFKLKYQAKQAMEKDGEKFTVTFAGEAAFAEETVEVK